MAEPDWLIRVIEYFSIATEEFLGEFALPQVELATLQKAWDVPATQPLVDCFPVGETQARVLHAATGINFDLTRHIYYLTAYTFDSAATMREGGYMGLYPPPREMPGIPTAIRVTPKTAG